MKKEIRNAVLYSGIFYMILTVILATIAYCNVITSVELSNDDRYIEKISEYKEKIVQLKDSSCKRYLSNLADKVEKDINTKELIFRESYKDILDGENILDMYSKAHKECVSLTSEKMVEANLPVKYLTTSMINDEIVSKYFYQYEINIKNIKGRELTEPQFASVENNIKLQNELEIIDTLLNIVDWEKEV